MFMIFRTNPAIRAMGHGFNEGLCWGLLIGVLLVAGFCIYAVIKGVKQSKEYKNTNLPNMDVISQLKSKENVGKSDELNAINLADVKTGPTLPNVSLPDVQIPENNDNLEPMDATAFLKDNTSNNSDAQLPVPEVVSNTNNTKSSNPFLS